MPVTISGDNGVSKVQDGVIVQADLVTAILPLGVGQNWINVVGIRSSNQDYLNDTGRPILVNIVVTATASVNNATAIAQGVNVGLSGLTSGASSTLSFIVPADAVYRCNTTNSNILYWSELR